MAEPIIMPRQGQSVESCIITEWHKKKGEQIKKGDILFAYETDKASFEEESEHEGILLDIFFDDGDEVPVLTNVGVIGKEGESTDEYKPDKGAGTQDSASKDKELDETTPMEKESEEESAPYQQPDQETVRINDGKISPRAKRLANDKGLDYAQISGSGPEGRIIERDILHALDTTPKITAKAKKAMQEEEYSAPSEGSGLGGNITYSDLSASNNVYAEDHEVMPLSNIRKRIAKAMHASLQNSAQLTHHMSADARNILRLRKIAKKKSEEGYAYNITLNDMVCYAVIRALLKHPEANVHLIGDSMRQFKKIHLGLAVDTERGLMVPAIKNADDLSLTGLSSQLKAVVEACRKGNIDPDLLSGEAATFTVSNLGNYGVEMFTPVLNLPQAGILGVNTIIQRPAPLNDGSFGFVPYMGLSLTYDHRALDGGPATKLLAAIKTEIENFDITTLD
ncbi:MAG: 2-oxo acid dehydrogenase subunit E2 [Bacteroidetes bacterium]|jgi:pyruvate dehydrogenase E2 component (dihydrolipoamide acetyltransferase)|nr:2-oxo acid dehydrogenase subunit E2 [Bacteroidota bacterium]